METSTFRGKREVSEDNVFSDPGDAKRRRPPPSSSRGVANLSPEQLAKKRANDREAQRAIRERTKNYIESLEKRIRDLTSQQPYQEMQHVIREKEIIEAENADIKARLAMIFTTIQPVLGVQSLNSPDVPYPSPSLPYTSEPPGSSIDSNTLKPINVTAGGAAVEAVGSSETWQNPAVPISNDSQGFSMTVAIERQRQDLSRGLDMGPEKLGFEFLLDGTHRINKATKEGDSVHTSVYQESPLLRREHDDDTFLYNHSGDSVAPRLGYVIPNELAAHAAPIRNSAPSCPLDNILLDFLHERQKQAAEGVATPKLVGPAYPSVSSLLNPAQSIHAHPLSKVFTDILATFPALSKLPEQVAVLYIMFLVMRWQISPTQENYDRLPEWMTPRPSQLFTPHPAWIDHIPWPKMRDKIVREYKTHNYILDNFFIPFTTTLSLNWPYEDTDTLLSTLLSDELTINPVFERHLRRLENWSLGMAFAQAFPGLADTYRLK